MNLLMQLLTVLDLLFVGNWNFSRLRIIIYYSPVYYTQHTIKFSKNLDSLNYLYTIYLFTPFDGTSVLSYKLITANNIVWNNIII